MITITETNLDDGYFTDTMLPYFEQFSEDRDYYLVDCERALFPFFKMVLDTLGKDYEYHLKDDSSIKFDIPKNEKDVLVAFSGGKDSVASALWLRDNGYNPILVFITNTSNSYPNELEIAENFAKEENMELIVKYIKKKGKYDFPDDPIKNNFILCQLLDIGIKRGITKYTTGCFKHDTLNDVNPLYNMSDTYELWQEFNYWVGLHFPNYEMMFLWRGSPETTKFMYTKHFDELPLAMSCVTPYRFQKLRRTQNMSKYNVDLLPNRCGSCRKCCLEWLVGVHLGYLPDNEGFREHCFSILRGQLKDQMPQIKQPEYELTDKEIFDIYFYEDDMEGL